MDSATATIGDDGLRVPYSKAASDLDITERAETCRICRSEGTADEALFHPCKCSGSIKYVHQDCLMEWLAHSRKKHCELCKTAFRFTKLYDANMPTVLPWSVFIQKALIHAVLTILYVLRLILVGKVWLLALPWMVRWAWRWMFWIADVGWARDLWLREMTARAQTDLKLPSNGDPAMLNTTEPIMLAATRILAAGLGLISVSEELWSADVANITYPTSFHRPDSSLLSSWKYISQLTSDKRLNRTILDICEGQIITSLVIAGFILVFLIREWVVQQQPLVNHEPNVQAPLQLPARADARANEPDGRQTQLNPVAGHTERLRDLQMRNILVQALSIEDVTDIEFHGLPNLDEMIDQAMEKFRSGNGSNVQDFDLLARAVVEQVALAPNAGIDLPGFVASFKSKLAAFSDAELQAWQTVARRRAERRIDTTAESTAAANPVEADCVPNTNTQELMIHTDSSETSGSTSETESNTGISKNATLIEDMRNERDEAAHRLIEDTKVAIEQLMASALSRKDPNAHLEALLGGPVTYSAEIPVTNAGPDAKSNILCSSIAAGRAITIASAKATSKHDQNDEVQEVVIDASLNPQSAAQAQSPESDVAEAHEADHFPLGTSNRPPIEDAERASQRASDAQGLGDSEAEMSTSQPGSQAVEQQTASVADPPRFGNVASPTRLTWLTDWFWGDIIPPNREEHPHVVEAARNETDVIEAAALQLAHVHEEPEEEVVQRIIPLRERPGDPEVLAAADQAGIEAEVVEEIEDLDGILELVGLQGPFLGLLQTSAFCTVLIIGTVVTAIALPYLWGKLVLAFIANPLYFAIHAPLRFASFIADTIVDVALLIVGWTILVAVTFTRLVLSGWLPGLRDAKFYQWISSLAAKVSSSSGGRLQAYIELLDGQDPIGVGYPLLSASAYAHTSLIEIKRDVHAVLSMTGNAVNRVVEVVSESTVTKAWSDQSLVLSWHNITSRAQTGVTVTLTHMRPWIAALRSTHVGTLGYSTPEVNLEPLLVFWTTNDRTLTVLVGYLALAALATIYVATDMSITQSQTGQKTEKIIRDSLRQAGGVVKVILIISIEMLVFPFYCGILLDMTFLPLFEHANIATRWQFALGHPYMFCFIHWFLGTCYMFHFALFVGMCRKILRKGVLWFIRDPDDPTFHPVRDVLERSVVTQLRKIAFSALVYGALVVLCLGGVIWSLDNTFETLFPIQWTTKEPALEFPLDLLMYNAVTPIMIRFLKPSDAVHAMYAWWLRRCARFLRLSHFLFNNRREDEEGLSNQSLWSKFSFTSEPGIHSASLDMTSAENEANRQVHFIANGKYVLTPNSDQYRPPKRGEAILHADDAEVFIVDRSGKKSELFEKVYIPPLFRLRITLFMVCLWIFSILLGLSCTLLPLAVGRKVLGSALRSSTNINDIYAYSFGSYLLGGCLFLLLGIKSAIQHTLKAKTFKVPTGQFLVWVKSFAGFAGRAVKCVYAYGFVGIILPLIMALVIQFYVIVPLRTYIASTSVINKQIIGTDRTSLESLSAPASRAAVLSSTLLSSGGLTQPTIHVLQDYCLGILYVRVMLRGLHADHFARVVEGARRITAEGFLNPSFRLVTRYIVLPTILLVSVVLLAPAILARLLFSGLSAMQMHVDLAVDQILKTKLYRYAYPMMAASIFLTLAGAGIVRAVYRWRNQIRDEVYLVGERLHNFGESRPPEESRTLLISSS